MAQSLPAGPTDALPVHLSLAGAHTRAISRWIAGVAGWQPIDDETATLMPPRVVIADVAGTGVREDNPRLPTVLLVSADDPPVVAATAARDADAVLSWPDRRNELVGTVSRLVDEHGGVAPREPELRVGGATGGVGTTTVALTLAGLLAWKAGPVLLIGHGAIPVRSVRHLAAEDVAAPLAWRVATPVPGVGDLRVLRLPSPGATVPADPGPARHVVRDAGVDLDVDVLVLRRDAGGLDALRRSAAAVSVVVDAGPASAADVVAAAGRRRLVTIAWSARVARAALQCRIPAGLPGSWVDGLRPVLAGVVR